MKIFSLKRLLFKTLSGGLLFALYNLWAGFSGMKTLAISVVNIAFTVLFGVSGVLALLLWEFFVKNFKIML